MSLANIPATHKPKAYFARFGDHGERSGILIKPAADVLFFDTEARTYTAITPANAMRVVVLDEVGHFMAQYYEDQAQARQERLALRQAA